MTWSRLFRAAGTALSLCAYGLVAQAPLALAQPPAGATRPGPVVVVETTKGVFEFETYPADAPKTVARVLELVTARFYDGQRVHRVIPNFVIQWGDPTTRDLAKRDVWGLGGSGTPVGAAETKRKHVIGAVAMAHAGNPAAAESQIYVTLADTPGTRALDGQYAVFGSVITGIDVVAKIAVDDRIVRMTIRP